MYAIKNKSGNKKVIRLAELSKSELVQRYIEEQKDAKDDNESRKNMHRLANILQGGLTCLTVSILYFKEKSTDKNKQILATKRKEMIYPQIYITANEFTSRTNLTGNQVGARVTLIQNYMQYLKHSCGKETDKSNFAEHEKARENIFREIASCTVLNQKNKGKVLTLKDKFWKEAVEIFQQNYLHK